MQSILVPCNYRRFVELVMICVRLWKNCIRSIVYDVISFRYEDNENKFHLWRKKENIFVYSFFIYYIYYIELKSLLIRTISFSSHSHTHTHTIDDKLSMKLQWKFILWYPMVRKVVWGFRITRFHCSGNQPLCVILTWRRN